MISITSKYPPYHTVVLNPCSMGTVHVVELSMDLLPLYQLVRLQLLNKFTTSVRGSVGSNLENNKHSFRC